MSCARFALLSALLAPLVVAAPASASVAFPEALRQELELTAVVPPAPGCQLCHRDDVGGLKTVTTPFGRSMMASGATAVSVPALLGALRALEANGTDSDGDGVSDVAELRAGMDANVGQRPDGTPSEPVEQVPLPQTGCAVGRGGSSLSCLCWAGLSLLWLLSRARRR